MENMSEIRVRYNGWPAKCVPEKALQLVTHQLALLPASYMLLLEHTLLLQPAKLRKDQKSSHLGSITDITCLGTDAIIS